MRTYVRAYTDAHAGVYVRVCVIVVVGAVGCIPLTVLVYIRQCCLLTCVCLPLFKTPSVPKKLSRFCERQATCLLTYLHFPRCSTW